MSIKPILFNTDMVRAILDGRETVTRRVVKPQPEVVYVNGEHRDIVNRNQIAFKIMDKGGKDCYTFPPYQPEDTIYIRETWNRNPLNEYGNESERYIYKATYDGHAGEVGWRPSIHMPKEAARIWLKVTNVRVERLQDITREQAEREGACDYTSTADGFADIWDSTVKKEDFNRHGWQANPWVWVIEFERCDKPQEVSH